MSDAVHSIVSLIHAFSVTCLHVFFLSMSSCSNGWEEQLTWCFVFFQCFLGLVQDDVVPIHNPAYKSLIGPAVLSTRGNSNQWEPDQFELLKKSDMQAVIQRSGTRLWHSSPGIYRPDTVYRKSFRATSFTLYWILYHGGKKIKPECQQCGRGNMILC